MESGGLENAEEIVVFGKPDPWIDRRGDMGQRQDVHSLASVPNVGRANINPLSGHNSDGFNQAEDHSQMINEWKEEALKSDKVNYVNCTVDEIVKCTVGKKVSDNDEYHVKYRIQEVEYKDKFSRVVLAVGAGQQRPMPEWTENHHQPPYYSGADYLDGPITFGSGKKVLIYGGGATAAWCVRKAIKDVGIENVSWLARKSAVDETLEKTKPHLAFSKRVGEKAWVKSNINEDIQQLVESGNIDCTIATVTGFEAGNGNKYKCTVDYNLPEKGDGQIYQSKFGTKEFDYIVGAIGQTTFLDRRNTLIEERLKSSGSWQRVHIKNNPKNPTVALEADKGNVMVIGAAVNSVCDIFWPDEDANTLYSGLGRFAVSSAQVPAGIPYLLISLYYLTELKLGLDSVPSSTPSANLLDHGALDRLLCLSISNYLKYMFKEHEQKLLTFGRKKPGFTKEEVISVITDQIIGFTQRGKIDEKGQLVPRKPEKESYIFGLTQHELDELWWLLKESAWEHVKPSEDDFQKLQAISAVLEEEAKKKKGKR
jgi:hypothetical protein